MAGSWPARRVVHLQRFSLQPASMHRAIAAKQTKTNFFFIIFSFARCPGCHLGGLILSCECVIVWMCKSILNVLTC